MEYLTTFVDLKTQESNVSVQFEKFDDTNEAFDSFVKYFKAFTDMQNVLDGKCG